MKNRRKTNEEYINQAKEIHNNFYDYSVTDYKNRESPIEIGCPFHGVFSLIEAKDHISTMKRGCPSCKLMYNYINKIETKFGKNIYAFDYSSFSIIEGDSYMNIYKTTENETKIFLGRIKLKNFLRRKY